MCTVKTQDSNNGVIQVRVAHHVKSVSVSRQFKTMKAEPELPSQSCKPKWKRRAQLPPLCRVPSWHAEVSKT